MKTTFFFSPLGEKRASNIRKTDTRVLGLLLLLRHIVFLTFTTAAVPSKRFMGFLTRNRRRRTPVRPYNFRLISEYRSCHERCVCARPRLVYIQYIIIFIICIIPGTTTAGLFEFPGSFPSLVKNAHYTVRRTPARARRPPSARYIFYTIYKCVHNSHAPVRWRFAKIAATMTAQ